MKKIKPVKVNLIDASNGTNGVGWTPFCGRARRSEYWAKQIKAFILLIASLALLYFFLMNTGSSNDGGLLMAGVFGVIISGLWLGIVLPVTVRRFHDRNMSGWWLLLFILLSLIPFVGWIASVVQFVIIGCLEGTVGPNQFGADPKAKEHTALLSRLIAAQASNDAASHGAQPDLGTQSESSVRLRKLQELRAQGLISAAEYEEKRSKVLETI